MQFVMQHDEWMVKENISALRQLMSDQNLQLLPDYEQRISVLRDLGFVDENSRVELKGKVACEVCWASYPCDPPLVHATGLKSFHARYIRQMSSSLQN